MSKREVCANHRCAHEKTSHHSEFESTGDVTVPIRRVYHACLALWCECEKYKPEAR